MIKGPSLWERGLAEREGLAKGEGLAQVGLALLGLAWRGLIQRSCSTHAHWEKSAFSLVDFKLD